MHDGALFIDYDASDGSVTLRVGVLMVGGSKNINQSSGVQRLAYSLDELAEATGLSKRMLWELTNRNEIPHRRVGRRILYPVKQIESWLEDKSPRQ
jgi:excisionase family DNA binding protein